MHTPGAPAIDEPDDTPAGDALTQPFANELEFGAAVAAELATTKASHQQAVAQLEALQARWVAREREHDELERALRGEAQRDEAELQRLRAAQPLDQLQRGGAQASSLVPSRAQQQVMSDQRTVLEQAERKRRDALRSLQALRLEMESLLTKDGEAAQGGRWAGEGAADAAAGSR